MNDFLIIGQGLAGTILADHLIQRGQRVQIINENAPSTSSKVAAGIVNPITGRRFTKSWMADKLLPFAQKYYSTKEQLFNSRFYHVLPITRFFSSIEEQNNWMGKSASREFATYVSDKIDEFPDSLKADYGGFDIRNGGYLNTNRFLELCRNHFLDQGVLREESFDFSKLQVHDGCIEYDGNKFSNIIFCEGHRAMNNPYFKWLPFNCSKGELLKVDFSNLPNDKILNKNGFILPVENNSFLVGATFSWDKPDHNPTKEARDELEEKISKITNSAYAIQSQRAAIRPTVKDRRPFIGAHPTHKNMFIFNGMGAKGVSLIPYFSDHFCNYLLEQKELIGEANIARFFSLYLDS